MFACFHKPYLFFFFFFQYMFAGFNSQPSYNSQGGGGGGGSQGFGGNHSQYHNSMGYGRGDGSMNYQYRQTVWLCGKGSASITLHHVWSQREQYSGLAVSFAFFCVCLYGTCCIKRHAGLVSLVHSVKFVLCLGFLHIDLYFFQSTSPLHLLLLAIATCCLFAVMSIFFFRVSGETLQFALQWFVVFFCNDLKRPENTVFCFASLAFWLIL